MTATKSYGRFVRAANPYRPQPGGQPPLLVGRDGPVQVVKATFLAAREGGAMRPTVFVGLRGMGKTALLRHCLNVARDDGAVVVSIEATAEIPLGDALAEGLSAAKRSVSIGERVRGVVADAADGLRRVIPGASYELPNEMDSIELALRDARQAGQPLQNALHDLNAIVRRRGRYLVLAIDEIQETPTDGLRDVIMFVHASETEAGSVVFLGAGLTNSASHLHDARTYTERWRYPRLDLLNAADTRDAIAVPAQAQGVHFTKDALDVLVDETGGYPFFIQEYAATVWTYSTGPTIDARAVEARSAGIRRELDEQFYDPRFSRLTDRECAYVLGLVSLGEGPYSVQDAAQIFGVRSQDISSVRNRLVTKEVLFAPAPGQLEFRMPLSTRYIERNYDSLERRARTAPIQRKR